MTVSISKKVIENIGKLEEGWYADNTLTSDDTLNINGNRYTFSASDFYTNDTLAKKLESITGGAVQIDADRSGNLKYLVYYDKWSTALKVINNQGANVLVGTSPQPQPKPWPSPSPSPAPEDDD